jgi:hypothetical protein
MLQNEVLSKRDILIVSDSQAALQAIQSFRITSLQVYYCIEKLNELGRENNLRLVWVPGHEGIDGNEEADQLARKGSELEHQSSLYTCGVTIAEIKKDIKTTMNEECEKYFQNTTGLRQSKKFISHVDYKRALELLSMTKERMRWTIGVFTGHGKFRYHLKKIKLIDDDTCRYCDMEEESAEHIICHCDRLMHKRFYAFGNHYLDPPDMSGYKLTRINKFLELIGITILDS